MTGAGRYLRSVGILRKMLEEGILDEGDFAKAEEEIARRNRIDIDSILRPNPLIKPEERAINDDGREESENEENHPATIREIAR